MTGKSPASIPAVFPVPAILVTWLATFRPCFTAPAWTHILVLVAGAVLAPGKRTVSQALRVMGLADQPGFGHFVKASGLRWLCLAVVLPVPFAGKRWSLPFLTVLAPSARGRRHKILTGQARQAIVQSKRWLADRRVVVVAESSFAALELIAAVRRHVCLITRLRLDANLSEPAPARSAGKRGRPALKGPRLAKLSAVLVDPATVWTQVTMAAWYGGQTRVLDYAAGVAVWYSCRMPPALIRWVLVRDPSGACGTQAFLCTDTGLEPVAILSQFVLRWRIETTFQEVRQHLGAETQRQWSDLAILRTTPALPGPYSLITVWAHGLMATPNTAVRRHAAAWYANSSQRSAMQSPPSAACSGCQRIYPDLGKTPEPWKFPPNCYNASCRPCVSQGNCGKSS